MRKTLICLAAVSVIFWAAGAVQAAHSDHGCHNCHLPHKSGDPTDPAAHGVPLWSDAQTADGLPTFTLYSSASFDALGTDIGQPDGPSKLCLGCHDGSYAVFGYIPDSQAIFGPDDLARTHPISFTYDTALANNVANGALRDPAIALSSLGGTIADDLLDDQSKVQCTSCHDVHLSGKTEYLLHVDIDIEGDEALCRICHDK